MYSAIIARVGSVQAIRGADRIKLATVVGHSTIVGADTQVGDLGILFPPDGVVSHEHAHHNNLYKAGKGENLDPTKNGYLDESRRIRTIRMKGESSEGIFMSLDSIKWTGAEPSVLTEGHQFTHLAGKLVCEKYYSRATRNRITGQNANTSGDKKAKRAIQLHQHYDTPQLRYNLSKIPDGATLYFTEKLHGTSGRTGRVLADTKLSQFQLWWNWLACMLGLPGFATEAYTYCSGTRRVNLDPDFEVDKGYYDGSFVRKIVHDEIVRRGLQKGETLYYEIVGFDDRGKRIMPAHHLHEKDQADWIKHFGTDEMVYRYGCVEKGVEGQPAFDSQFRVFVYRITIQDEDGNVHEIPWSKVKARCHQLGLRVVPEITGICGDSGGPLIFQEGECEGALTGRDKVLQHCKKHSDGPSTLDSTHIREGVCVMVESDRMTTALKYKGWNFSHCEGIRKDDDAYMDPEEIA